jgi:TRAP-type C4-dicarboxylate transport system permease small subunit
VASPALQLTVGRYLNRRYRQVSNLGSTIAMERSPDFHQGFAFLLLFLFGVGALVYAVVYAIQKQANTHRVELCVTPDGQVQEVGYTLRDLERDKLALSRRWRLFWVIVLWLLAALCVLAGIGTAAGPTPGYTQDRLVSDLIFDAVVAVLAILGGLYLFRSARRIAQRMRTSYPS